MPVTKTYTILALNFQTTAGGEIAINDVFKKTDGMTAGNALAAADNLQVMNDDGTYAYYYLSNGYIGSKAVEGTENKWVNNSSLSTRRVATTDTLKWGKAFWYVSRAFASGTSSSSYNLQVAGQVLSKSAETKEIAANYVLVGNPYPCEISLNDGVQITKNCTAGNALAAADNLQIQKEDGTYAYYYFSNGYIGTKAVEGTANKWVNNASLTTRRVATTDKFPISRGAWFHSINGDSQITFTK